ncbi:MAG: PIN domain-containing protein [Planctomycetota bacterium]|nr:PIN domain-containing protein [Planctomycetota bacterium]
MTQFTVIYDANVLYPFNMRDLLIQLAQPELDLVRARWTEEILDEAFRNLLANNPHLKTAQLSRTRELMCQSVPDCLVEGYESLIADLELPDPNDRHVLAAAIRVNAEVIVTLNLKDFPSESLQTFDLEAQEPDAFLLNLI